MHTVTLNTSTALTICPTSAPKEAVWNNRKIKPVGSESSCLTQKEIRFSDRIALIPTAPPPLETVEVIYFDWNRDEPELRFADPAPYVPKNYEENLTVEELLERTGYKFATFDELQIDECKKAKDRVVGWWKSGVKWAKKHKKELILAGVILGAGGFTLGVVLLVSSATAEAAVATGAAVGAAVAGNSGSKKKEDEENHTPQSPKETVSTPPSPPPFIPVIDGLPSTAVKPQSPKETTSAPPSIDVYAPPSNKPQSGRNTTLEPLFIPPIDFQSPGSAAIFQSQLQNQARIYSDYLIQHAINPFTPLPSLSALPAPAVKHEEHVYSSMFQTILKGFSYIGMDVIDNLDLFRSDSPLDPFCNAYSDLVKKHNTSSGSHIWPTSSLLNIAPLKSTYYEYLNLLANYKAPRSPEAQPPCSVYHSLEGFKPKGMQVTFINGMDNNWSDFLGNIQHLRSLGSLQVDGVYNCTHGKLFDVAEIIALNLVGSSPVTEEMLMKQFTDFAKANKDDPRAKCLHYCHSQGALHTRNALQKLPKEIRDRVIVVSVGGACVVPKRLCFTSFNYVSERDIVYKLEDLYKKGGLSLPYANDEQHYEISQQEQKDAQEFIVLKASEGATGFDHGFKELTYVQELKGHLIDYTSREGKY